MKKNVSNVSLHCEKKEMVRFLNQILTNVGSTNLLKESDGEKYFSKVLNTLHSKKISFFELVDWSSDNDFFIKRKGSSNYEMKKRTSITLKEYKELQDGNCYLCFNIKNGISCKWFKLVCQNPKTEWIIDNFKVYDWGWKFTDSEIFYSTGNNIWKVSYDSIMIDELIKIHPFHYSKLKVKEIHQEIDNIQTQIEEVEEVISNLEDEYKISYLPYLQDKKKHLEMMISHKIKEEEIVVKIWDNWIDKDTDLDDVIDEMWFFQFKNIDSFSPLCDWSDEMDLN